MATQQYAAATRDGTNNGTADRILLPWDKDSYPTGVTLATVTAVAEVSWVLNRTSGAALVLDTADAKFTWTSTDDGAGHIATGSEVAIGQVFRRDASGLLVVRASIMTPNTARFSEILLSVADTGS